MGSQSTGLGVKNPRANCAWRNLRPSSAQGPTIISVAIISAGPDFGRSSRLTRTALTLPDASDLHNLFQSREPAQPRTPLRFSFSLSCSLVPGQTPKRPKRLANPGQPILSARARSRAAFAIHRVAASTDGCTVAGSKAAAGGDWPFF